MKYVLDFDGTIIDLWPRYYQVFSDSNGIKTIPFELYKLYKKNYEKDEVVGEKLYITLSTSYFEEKKRRLEDLNYLKLDTLFIDKDRLLNFFFREDAIILTKRCSSENFYKELDILGLNELAAKSFVISNKELSKVNWLVEKYNNENVTIIGDGQEELKCQNRKNTDVVMVDTGLLNLENYKNLGIKKYDSLDLYMQSINY